MILPFSTQLNGKPTFFVDKIIKGLHETVHAPLLKEFLMDVMVDDLLGISEIPTYPRIDLVDCKPKIHTIREDKKDRWKEGMEIDFFINTRRKDMFRFSPRIPVVSVQNIFMTRRGSMLEITIAKVGSYIGGEDFYLDAFNQGTLALNDGFEEYDDFRNYFLNAIEKNGKSTGNYWFSGKIIHWTDLKY